MQDETQVAGAESFVDVISQNFYRWLGHVFASLVKLIRIDNKNLKAYFGYYVFGLHVFTPGIR